MPAPSIDNMPEAPAPTDSRAAFSAKSFSFFAAVATLVAQVNTAITWIGDQAAAIAGHAFDTAADREQTGLDAASASASAASASASAASAAAIAGAFVGTSATAHTIGPGSKTFVTQSGEQYTAGIWVSAVSAANQANWMVGQVTAYAGTSLTIEVSLKGGAGTFADWNLSLAGVPGATGPAGGVNSVNGVQGDVVNIATTDTPQTLSGKRIPPRVGSVASSATPAIDIDAYDIVDISALAVNITSMSSGLSGTPANGQPLIIRITGTAARTIAWGTAYESSVAALPTTTTGTAMLTVGLMYNAASGKWRCVGAA